MQLNKHSKRVTQDTTQPAAQVMLYAVDFTEEDLKMPQVAIASKGYNYNSCNKHGFFVGYISASASCVMDKY
ncbi:hypothetical protein EC396_04760 [Lutibacter sp. HS1-25]|uniref:hypothetical protein n=1 Tax=Lutibacter sp. HS1-25 TaxID=2485000 RepID=UPI0010111A7E|nr:hypothetical protein [Lutibacter sp. HS1-25]RXP60329.1 hypothetical protein EC396_04760 [Lutibacter sp. HS1-25]